MPGARRKHAVYAYRVTGCADVTLVFIQALAASKYAFIMQHADVRLTTCQLGDASPFRTNAAL